MAISFTAQQSPLSDLGVLDFPVNFIYCLCVCTRARPFAYHNEHIQVRGQLVGLSALKLAIYIAIYSQR